MGGMLDSQTGAFSAHFRTPDKAGVGISLTGETQYKEAGTNY